jgi:hypothetical protein
VTPFGSRSGRASAASLLRPLLVAALLSLLLAGVAAAYIGWNVLQGAGDLRAAAGALERAAVVSEGPADPRQLLAHAASRTTAGREQLADPAVRLAGSLPLVGRPLRSATAMAVSADAAIGGALLPLAEAAGDQPQRRLFREDGAIDVAFLSSLQEPSSSASSTLASAMQTAASAPSRSGITEIDEARTRLLLELDRLGGGIADLALATRVGPALLGADGARHYLIVPQNPAEARGTGGLVGGYVLIRADAGKLTVVDNGSNRDLDRFHGGGPPVVDLTPEFAEHYGHNAPASAWVNSNLSPHFPYAASIWRGFWQRQTGQQVDGLLTLDPVALSYVLAATGEVRLDDGEIVTDENIVELTLRDAYVDFADDTQSVRRQYLQQVSTRIGERLTTTRPDVDELLPALSRAISERRLLLWTGDPTIDGPLAERTVSGRLPVGRPIVGDVIVNAAGSKLDYYLDRTLTYTQACDGSAKLALRLHNDAPASGLPDYVSVPQFRQGLPEGTNKSLVTLYVPGDSRVVEVRQDGERVEAQQGSELGHRWIELLVTLRPGETAELAVDLVREGAPRSLPERLAQPLVRPEAFSATGCTDR